MDKKLYWSIKITLGIVGVVALFQIVPYFQNLLYLIVDMFKLTGASPEFKIILLCLSIWVTCSVFNVITNLIFKLQEMLKVSDNKKNETLPTP